MMDMIREIQRGGELLEYTYIECVGLVRCNADWPQACDMCRKKKIKCDGKMPACTHCQNYKTECIFTQVEKKRQPPKGLDMVQSYLSCVA
jgi:hypothetical protein